MSLLLGSQKETYFTVFYEHFSHNIYRESIKKSFCFFFQIKSESDNFFIINVSEINQIVQAVLCRGSLYPLTNPRPMVSELPMQIPMCSIESEKTQMEEQLIRCVNFCTEHADAKMKEIAIKLFAVNKKRKRNSLANILSNFFFQL